MDHLVDLEVLNERLCVVVRRALPVELLDTEWQVGRRHGGKGQDRRRSVEAEDELIHPLQVAVGAVCTSRVGAVYLHRFCVLAPAVPAPIFACVAGRVAREKACP
jgi:hypothetical protein